MGKIYLLSTEDENGNIVYKIGVTKRDVNVRIKELQTGNSQEINLINVYETDEFLYSIEKSLHRKFNMKKIRNGEWFKLNDNDADNFLSLCEQYHNNFKIVNNSLYSQEKGLLFK